MGLTISSLFSRLFGKKQMRILMGEPLAASCSPANGVLAAVLLFRLLLPAVCAGCLFQ